VSAAPAPFAARSLRRGAADATLLAVLRTRHRPRARHRQAGVALGVVALVLVGCGTDPDIRAKDRQSSRGPTTTGPAESTTTTTAPTTYTVQRGDNLSAIAKIFHVALDALMLANGIESADRIAEGQVLQIPPSTPVTISVTPPSAATNTVFEIAVSGAIPGEAVTFAITSPDGGVFEGPPHAVPPEGNVSASYRSAGEPPGTFTVVAEGDRGTNATVTFVVEG
jgi:LysM repeat protein